MMIALRKLILLSLAIVPISAMAGPRWYIGVHGNTSASRFFISESRNQTPEAMFSRGARLDDGNSGSNVNFSLTGGFEFRQPDKNSIAMIWGGELFFDHIRKTVVQRDDYFASPSRPGLMNGWPVYRTNFLTGVRGKFGLNLYNFVDLYGTFGLAYWDRNLYINRSGGVAYWDRFNSNILGAIATPRVRPVFGIGTNVHITDSFAINAKFTYVTPNVIGGVFRSTDGLDYNYSTRGLLLTFSTFTLGVRYYF
jgi:hypothetical protein